MQKTLNATALIQRIVIGLTSYPSLITLGFEQLD